MNNKFVFFILTSSNHKLLKICYNTLINQKNHNIDYTIIIVVNSTNPNYIIMSYQNLKILMLKLFKQNQMENLVWDTTV